MDIKIYLYEDYTEAIVQKDVEDSINNLVIEFLKSIISKKAEFLLYIEFFFYDKSAERSTTGDYIDNDNNSYFLKGYIDRSIYLDAGKKKRIDIVLCGILYLFSHWFSYLLLPELIDLSMVTLKFKEFLELNKRHMINESILPKNKLQFGITVSYYGYVDWEKLAGIIGEIEKDINLSISNKNFGTDIYQVNINLEIAGLPNKSKRDVHSSKDEPGCMLYEKALVIEKCIILYQELIGLYPNNVYEVIFAHVIKRLYEAKSYMPATKFDYFGFLTHIQKSLSNKKR